MNPRKVFMCNGQEGRLHRWIQLYESEMSNPMRWRRRDVWFVCLLVVMVARIRKTQLGGVQWRWNICGQSDGWEGWAVWLRCNWIMLSWREMLLDQVDGGVDGWDYFDWYNAIVGSGADFCVCDSWWWAGFFLRSIVFTMGPDDLGDSFVWCGGPEGVYGFRVWEEVSVQCICWGSIDSTVVSIKYAIVVVSLIG